MPPKESTRHPIRSGCFGTTAASWARASRPERPTNGVRMAGMAQAAGGSPQTSIDWVRVMACREVLSRSSAPGVRRWLPPGETLLSADYVVCSDAMTRYFRRLSCVKGG